MRILPQFEIPEACRRSFRNDLPEPESGLSG